MVNFRDPVIAEKDYRAHAIHDLLSGIQMLINCSLNSGSQEPLWYYMRHIPVCPYPTSTSRCNLGPTPISSWEYFTTLHYELDVMRGHRPYRWTIWVCNNRRL